MATVQNTIEFLLSHGNVNHAAETPEGVIATTWAGSTYNAAAVADCDTWCEEVAVFPVEGGNVSTSAVRAFLGY